MQRSGEQLSVNRGKSVSAHRRGCAPATSERAPRGVRPEVEHSDWSSGRRTSRSVKSEWLPVTTSRGQGAQFPEGLSTAGLTRRPLRAVDGSHSTDAMSDGKRATICVPRFGGLSSVRGRPVRRRGRLALRALIRDWPLRRRRRRLRQRPGCLTGRGRRRWRRRLLGRASWRSLGPRRPSADADLDWVGKTSVQVYSDVDGERGTPCEGTE